MARPQSQPGPEIASLPPASIAIGEPGASIESSAGNTTGRFVIIFKHEALADPSLVKDTLRQYAGIRNLAAATDYAQDAVTAHALVDNDATHFPKLGVVVVGPDDDRLQAISASAMDQGSAILAIEPEYIARVCSVPAAAHHSYLLGYKDAVNHLFEQLFGGALDPSALHPEMLAALLDNGQFTWGLQATRVHTSRYSGQGVKLAVLDTGFDLQHPDFQGRLVVQQSFVPNESAQDGHGHGTHCVGTSCGPQNPVGRRRYGIAYGAQIHVGKVLSNQGSGATGGIIAGMEWAMGQGCQVVSMSLSADINQKVQQYEVPIRRALAAGTLVVAAAGNNANRKAGNFGFVGAPANADAAMAVAAVDSSLGTANFSARSSATTGDGGKINIAGPGVNVESSWPMPTRYNSISGTSMATPHVAGIAALWCQATGATGAALWTRLTQNARPLKLASMDVGSGLVQAPQ